MSLSTQMQLEEELEDLKHDMQQIFLNAPATSIAFDGNIPRYIKSAFDHLMAENRRLEDENRHLRTRADFLHSELVKFVKISVDMKTTPLQELP